MATIIEVTGIPGSGKSTFVTELVERCREAGISCACTRECRVSAKRVALELLRVVVTAPRRCIVLLRATGRRVVVGEYRHIYWLWYWYGVSLAQYRWANKQTGIVVSDEGLLHRALTFSVFTSSQTNEQITEQFYFTVDNLV